MSMRMIPIPPEIPAGFEEIIMVFAEHDAKGNTGTMMHFSGPLLEALKKMTLAGRVRIIKTICKSIEEGLLQSGSNPDDFKIREITGP